MHSTFQFIPKVFSVVEVGALCVQETQVVPNCNSTANKDVLYNCASIFVVTVWGRTIYGMGVTVRCPHNCGCMWMCVFIDVFLFFSPGGLQSIDSVLAETLSELRLCQ